MNKTYPSWITISAVSLAAVSLVSAMTIGIQRKAAEKEADELRDQISRMEAYLPDPDAPIPETASFETIDTNDVPALVALLAEKDAEIVALRNPEEEIEEEKPERESWEDRMARMKEEEPEEYAEMIAKREERQQKMRYSLAERTATFMDLDTSLMTEEERANHEILIEKMANVWTLTEQFQDPEAAPDREAMRELFTELNEARPLMRDTRTVMFKQLGSELGYEGQDAEDFAAHVEDIIGATTIQVPGRGGRGGGGRGGGQ